MIMLGHFKFSAEITVNFLYFSVCLENYSDSDFFLLCCTSGYSDFKKNNEVMSVFVFVNGVGFNHGRIFLLSLALCI